MTLYLDTSVLVAALTREIATDRVCDWLGAQNGKELTISDWVVTEFSSALSIKLRVGSVDVAQRARILSAFHRLCADSLGILKIASSQFQTAARFADSYTLGLRAGDAMHLAICADHGATLCTLDRRLGDAGPPLGVASIFL